MSVLPTDDKLRKGLPLLKQITRYFPKALREITKVSVANNVRYNPGRDPFDINWARGKSTDQLGSAFRHIIDHECDGRVFEEVKPEVAAIVGYDKVYVLAELAWRALAALELEIEEQEALEKIANEPVAQDSDRTCSCGQWRFAVIPGEPIKNAVVLGRVHRPDHPCYDV